tara:strand:- start:94 stop:390 length:297 start_codon:yes stop_codon:yes gene_type:complete
MKKFLKIIKISLFVIFWLILTSYLDQFWNIFHWKNIFLKGRGVFDHEIWFSFKNILFGFDAGYYLEELFKFASYEIPKESFKFIPIYLFTRSIFLKNK